MSDKIFSREGSMSSGGDEGNLGLLSKSSSFPMNGMGSCDGGDGKKTVSINQVQEGLVQKDLGVS